MATYLVPDHPHIESFFLPPLTFHFDICYQHFLCMIQQPYKYVSSSLWPCLTFCKLKITNILKSSIPRNISLASLFSGLITLNQEKMTGQRGKLRALAGICHVHESYFQPSGSLFSETSACSLASLSGSQWHFVRHYMKSFLFFQTSDRGWPACGRLGRQASARTKTSARLKITFVVITYPKGWTESLPLCPLIFSWLNWLKLSAVSSTCRWYYRFVLRR